MNKVAKTMNPVVKTRSGEVRGSEASGVVEEFEMKPNFV
jgi:hypothetical protein